MVVDKYVARLKEAGTLLARQPPGFWLLELSHLPDPPSILDGSWTALRAASGPGGGANAILDSKVGMRSGGSFMVRSHVELEPPRPARHLPVPQSAKVSKQESQLHRITWDQAYHESSVENCPTRPSEPKTLIQ